MGMGLLPHLDGSLVLMMKNGRIELYKFCVLLLRPIRHNDMTGITKITNQLVIIYKFALILVSIFIFDSL